MTNWIARAKAHFSQKRQERTDETDITPISSVLSAGVGAVSEKTHGGFVGFVGTDREVVPKNEDSQTVDLCSTCAWFRRPGLSSGYCSIRADLPIAYGLLHELPADRGVSCMAYLISEAS